MTDELDPYWADNEHCLREIERLRGDNERLRAALARIAGGGERYDSASHLMQIAIRALEPKP